MLRRTQTPITIRSNRAAARLAVLTRSGRSQAAVIEDALDRMPIPQADDELARRIAEVELILDRTSARNIPSMAEFDASEYDEYGNPR